MNEIVAELLLSCKHSFIMLISRVGLLTFKKRYVYDMY